MTSRLLPLQLLLLLLLAIVAAAIADQPKVYGNDVSGDSRQHKAFFVNYPLMQRVHEDKDAEASESRVNKARRKQRPRKKKPAESEIYFIKLPPAPYSYVEGLGYISQPPVFSPASLPKPKPKPKIKKPPFVKLPIDFVSNGKPTRVYQYSDEDKKASVLRLNRGPYLFNGQPTGVYVMKKKPKRGGKPVLRTSNEYKKKVVVKQ